MAQVSHSQAFKEGATHFLILPREALLSVAQTFFENEDLGNEDVKVYTFEASSSGVVGSAPLPPQYNTHSLESCPIMTCVVHSYRSRWLRCVLRYTQQSETWPRSSMQS